MFPTAHHIGFSLVEACKAIGGNPLLIAMRTETSDRSRARHLAMQALIEVFPAARKTGLARCCGYPKPANWQPFLTAARRVAWWRDDVVYAIAEALKATILQGANA